MKKRFLMFKEILVNREGATATEYAGMLALVIMVAFTAIATLGGKVDESLTETVTRLEKRSE